MLRIRKPARRLDFAALGGEIRSWQQLIREVLVAPPVQDYAVRLVMATHPGGEFAAGGADGFLRWLH